MLANLLGGFINILIGVTLMPVIAGEVYLARFIGNDTFSTTNVTGAASTIISLVTLFFAIGIMAAGISLAVNGLKQAGLV